MKIIPHLKSEISQHLGHIRCKGSKLCEKAAQPLNCQTSYSKTKEKKKCKCACAHAQMGRDELSSKAVASIL